MSRKLTPKQEKVVSLTIANGLETKKTKTKGEILSEAGYSATTQKVPDEILNSALIQAEIKKRTAETVRQLEAARADAIAMLPQKIRKAPYNHLVNGIDILTRNAQLLSGKSTENKDIHISISEVVAQKNDPNVL